MQITHQHFFDASMDAVFAMLADHGFASTRGAASGATSSDAVIDGDQHEGFTLSIRRAVPATSIPAEFRSFVGSTLDVRYTEVWEPPSGDTRKGTFAVEIAGTPGHAAGSLTLSERDGGTDFVADGTVSVRVPLFGTMIEKAVATAVLRGLAAELESADAWLAGH